MPSSPFQSIIQQWADFANKGDAKDIAALYTSNPAPNQAVLIISQGPLHGQSEIQQGLQAQFNAGWAHITLTDDEDHEQGNSAWSIGTWKSGTPAANGWWSVLWVQQGTAWKIQQQSVVQAQ